jgi:dTDP-4-dehydrorhamnose reductase
MRILVTGRSGQVVQSLVERGAPAGVEIIPAGRPALDLTDAGSVRSVILSARPDLVVSAAAYTAVDQAEDEPDMAFAINARGAGLVAAAASEAGAPIIHLSTDYVFSGDKSGPHVETDAPDPRSVYGHSKLEGEQAVASANPRHVILRTAWVYSPFGRNFVRTMLTLAAQRDTIRVVADQWGNPTSAIDIADTVLRIAAALPGASDGSRYGVFHLAGSGDANWSGFARHVLGESGRLGGPTAQVEDIETADYPTKAYRPRNSRLSCVKMQDAYGITMPDWRVSCTNVVARLVAPTQFPG